MLNQKVSFGSGTQPSSKLKIMAHQYKRYHQQAKTKQTHKFSCLLQVFNKLCKHSGRVWNSIVPISIRGPATPYQTLLQKVKVGKPLSKDNELPFSKNTIDEDIEANNLTLLLVYKEDKVSELLQCIHHNNNVLNLAKSSVKICAISREDQTYRSTYSQKVSEILANKDMQKQEQFFVVLWRGLFNQIIALDVFSVRNECSYLNILEVIDKREQYEGQIKKMANICPTAMNELNSGNELHDKTNSTRLTSLSEL